MKTLLMEFILRLRVTMDELKSKNFCFEYFCRFVASALILRPWNRYIYVFRGWFGFCNFNFTSCGFQKQGVSSFFSTLNFDEIERGFWGLNVLVYGGTAKPLHWNYRHFFLRFQTIEPVLRVKKCEITGENTFKEDHLETEGNHRWSKDEK